MSEAPLDEPLAQFPELARARNLYIELFKDDSPLVNLGYTAAQLRHAKPVLSLIQEAGDLINPETSHPELWFEDDAGLQIANIS